MIECQESGHLFTASVRSSFFGDVTEWRCQRCGYIRYKSDDGRLSGMSTPALDRKLPSDTAKEPFKIYHEAYLKDRESIPGIKEMDSTINRVIGYLECPLIMKIAMDNIRAELRRFGR